MTEPANHTGWIDRFGDTWVRVDDCPGMYGTWWPLCDGPGWDEPVRGGVGQSREWGQAVPEYGPFTPADPERTARAIDRVRREVAQ